MFPFAVVDAHLHIFDVVVRDATFANRNDSHGFPEAVRPIARTHSASEARAVTAQAGVDDVVFVQCYNDCPEEAEWVHRVAQEHGLIKAIVAGLDPAKHDKLEEAVLRMKAFATPKLVGIRHLIDHDDEPKDLLLRPEVRRGLKFLSDEGLTFDLQSYDRIASFVPRLATALPDLKMVIDHLGKPRIKHGWDEDWAESMGAAAKFPNVYVKLSGFINEIDSVSDDVFKPYIDFCIDHFGSKRCMFGSDWPVCKLNSVGADYSDVLALAKRLTADRSDSDVKNIFRDTAIEFYGLRDVVKK